ncbi:MAG TPA: sulfite exporter TauE/SafE family protein, partial [Flavobacteriales bacterium]|nr:sulfite exporter TauE/SafE family protein [Flavobacteriales bacterium]
TSLGVLLLPVGILAVWNYHRAGNLDWKAALIIGGTFVLGAWAGSRLSLSLPPDTVKKVFGGVMILAALKLIFGK